jgi:hypothetical protein
VLREIFSNVEEGYDDLDAEKQKEIGLQFVYMQFLTLQLGINTRQF